MSATTCPVCAFENVPAGARQCPQCDSDLTCFQVLDTLPDELAVSFADDDRTGRERERFISTRGIALGAVSLLVIVSGLFALALFRLQSDLQRQRERVNGLESRLREGLSPTLTTPPDLPPGEPIASGRGGALGRDLVRGEGSGSEGSTGEQPVAEGGATTGSAFPAVRSDPSSGARAGNGSRAHGPGPSRREEKGGAAGDFFVYHPTDDDTLWGIARRFYGAGDLYPVLLEHNQHLEIYRIRSGLKIEVLRDAQEARAELGRITEMEQGRLFWYYTVRQGDTLRSIARKFHGPGSSTATILRYNPGAQIEAGKRIRIRLE